MNDVEVITRLQLILDELYSITDGECDVHGWVLVQLAIKHLVELIQELKVARL